VWANYEDPDYDPVAYFINAGIINIATDPELFALLEELLPGSELHKEVLRFQKSLSREDVL
jgi:hypothetical protein